MKDDSQKKTHGIGAYMWVFFSQSLMLFLVSITNERYLLGKAILAIDVQFSICILY